MDAPDQHWRTRRQGPPWAVRLGACLCAVLTPWAAARADESAGRVRTRAELGFAGRAYLPDDRDATVDDDLRLTGLVSVQQTGEIFHGRFSARGRVAAEETEASALSLEEAYLGADAHVLDLSVGFQILNWTATEAFHPADVVNARDLDSALENPDKLGEPMVALRAPLFAGAAMVAFMPFRIAPRLPGLRSRARPVPAGLRLGAPLFVGRDGAVNDDRFAPQFLARLSQTIGDADVALTYVDHTDRSQPGLSISTADGAVSPLYFGVHHLGLTYTHVLEDWIVKVEGAYRRFVDSKAESGAAPSRLVVAPENHGTAAVGLEYGFPTESGGEATLIAEGEAIFGPDKAERRRLTPFQRDVLLGARYSLGDVAGTEIEGFAIGDLEPDGGMPELLGILTARRRLDDAWSLAGTLRWVQAEDKGAASTGLMPLSRFRTLEITLTRHLD